jgi:hypothetical protein
MAELAGAAASFFKKKIQRSTRARQGNSIGFFEPKMQQSKMRLCRDSEIYLKYISPVLNDLGHLL